jgi:hypothetical protein
MLFSVWFANAEYASWHLCVECELPSAGEGLVLRALFCYAGD